MNQSIFFIAKDEDGIVSFYKKRPVKIIDSSGFIKYRPKHISDASPTLGLKNGECVMAMTLPRMVDET